MACTVGARLLFIEPCFVFRGMTYKNVERFTWIVESHLFHLCPIPQRVAQKQKNHHVVGNHDLRLQHMDSCVGVIIRYRRLPGNSIPLIFLVTVLVSSQVKSRARSDEE